MKHAPKIGLVAGNKRLPFQFTDWAKQNNYDLYIIGIKGEVDEALRREVPAENYTELFVCELSKGIKFFKKLGVRDVVMIGGIAKAKLIINLDIIRVAVRLLFIKNKHKGLFAVIMSDIAKHNITIHAIQEYMTELLLPQGTLGSIKPSDKDMLAFHNNLDAIIQYTRTGNGQAVVIYDGEIIAYENIRGTDALMNCAAIRRRELGGDSGGIMVKIMEPGQDNRLDLPVVGTGTVEMLAKYHLDGVIVEAGRAITDGTDDTVALADQKNIFIYGATL